MMLVFNSSGSKTAGLPLSVDFDSVEDFLVFIFQILFATTAVLVAGPVAISILATKRLRLQNRFIFMLNTSVCDTLVGFSVYYIGLFDVQEGFPSRNGTYNLLPSLLGVNIITFLFAQFDRYLAVCHPFIYSRFISRHVVIAACVYSWLHVYGQTTLFIFLPPAKSVQLYAFGMVCLQFFVLTKVIMTIKLYLIAKYQVERHPPGAEKDNKRESIRILIFVVISFLILWCPSFINIILRLLMGRGLRFRNEATNLFAIMARFSAVCTPGVYMWGESDSEGSRREESMGQNMSKMQEEGWIVFCEGWGGKTEASGDALRIERC